MYVYHRAQRVCMGERSYFVLIRHNFSQQYYVKYSALPSALCSTHGEAAWYEGKRPAFNSRRSH